MRKGNSEMKMNVNLVGSCIFTALFIMLACMVVWVILDAPSFDYTTLCLAITLILVCVAYIFIIWSSYKQTRKLDALMLKSKRVLLEGIEREEKRG